MQYARETDTILSVHATLVMPISLTLVGSSLPELCLPQPELYSQALICVGTL